MSSAKITYRVQDRSTIVPSMPGIYAGIVVTSDKGQVGTPKLITSTNHYISEFGKPNPRLGVSAYSALNYLKSGNKLWVSRAIAPNAKYSALLVRAKVIPINTTDPSAPFTDESLVVKPIEGGLTQDELDTFQFPLYRTNKEYEELITTITRSVESSDEIPVDTTSGLSVGDSISFSTDSLSQLNDKDTELGENTPTYQVLNIDSKVEKVDNVILKTPITGKKGTPLVRVVETKMTFTAGQDDPENPGTELTEDKTLLVKVEELIEGNPRLLIDTEDSTNVLCTNADFIHPGDILSINGTEVEFIKKDLLTHDIKFIKIDQRIDVSKDYKIFKVIQSEFEDRDAFLVASSSPGFDGNNISIGITPSKNYDDAFNVLVYYKGVLIENAWEVTRDYFLDGFQRQMFIEDKINGKSGYITIKNNPNCVNPDGHLCKPLFTDHSLWRKDPEDQFRPTSILLGENILLNHKEVLLSDVSGLVLGSRIKFKLDESGTLSKEYKVASIRNSSNTILLDRPLEEDKIPQEYTSISGPKIPTEVFKFDEDYNNPSQGIINGIKYFSIKRLNKVIYNYPLNAKFVISGESGTLLDPGANLMTGGTLGDPASVGDLIVAAKKLDNRGSTPVTLLMDGGFTTPAFANALVEVAKKQGYTSVYLSDPYESEIENDYLNSIVSYKDSLMLDTRHASLFSGWVEIYDEYNKRYVWTSPESHAVVSQSFTTKNYQFFTPAAGTTRGKVSGTNIRVKFDEGERDFLVDNQINPIKYDDGAMYIWGNETLYRKPSPLQLRSVNLLIIVIKHGLDKVLENKHFDDNDERTWIITEGAINSFMRDEIKAKKGVYDYRTAIQDIITNLDTENRRMPVYLGIQPTMDIEEIPVTLGIYNPSSGIDVYV